MSEQVKKTLYLLETRDNATSLGRLFTFYAKDAKEADTIVKEELLLHSELSCVSLSEHPDGFTFFHYHHPGHIVCKE